MTANKTTRFTHFDELLAVRMATPEFELADPKALPSLECESTRIFIDDLLEMGFIYSHEFTVTNAVGKDEGEPARLIAYMNAEESAYAVVTDLYHDDCWVQFTSYFAQGRRFVTTSQPGVMELDFLEKSMSNLTVQNLGTSPISNQWKRHKRLIAMEIPEATPLLFKPEQHLAAEKQFYRQYGRELLNNNILQQSDTQTVRFTRSGARTFHDALTSRSARRPIPKVEGWIGKRGRFPVKNMLSLNNLALAAAGVFAVGLVVMLQNSKDQTLSVDSATQEQPQVASTTNPAQPAVPAVTTTQSTLPEPAQLPDIAAIESSPETGNAATPTPDKSQKIDRQKILIADQEDEMWRIAVENAEFFLLSNDGDPAPWIRTARKIAAGFSSSDSRLARTYFLAALLEPDYRIAEQQFNRALSIQTKTLGLYHAETAQTLEALAWIAEHNKENLEEAITHQRLAINIYRDIFGANAEDTKAAQWKLEYFEDRLAGVRPKTDSNRRLLPALARFTR
jgi:hypothetical protein